MRASRICRAAALKSETPVPHFSDKVVRGHAPREFFRHPTYVLAREKLLSNMWKEHLVFKASVWGLTGFFAVNALFKA